MTLRPRRAGRDLRRRVMSEPNLIPLIDVSLILVIIFMVLTPILVHSQLTVKLPKALAASPPDAAHTVSVQISRGGALLVEGQPARWERLDAELALRLGRSSRKTLLVQADKTVAVEKVVTVLDAARRLGVGKLGIGVSAQSAR